MTWNSFPAGKAAFSILSDRALIPARGLSDRSAAGAIRRHKTADPREKPVLTVTECFFSNGGRFLFRENAADSGAAP
jgi:hypothetical protein